MGVNWRVCIVFSLIGNAFKGEREGMGNHL